MHARAQRWRHFWFAPTRPTNLGVCRALFCGLLLLLYWRYDFSLWTEVSHVFWKPTGLFKYLHLPVLSAPVLVVLQIVWKGALALSCIGLWTRVSTAVGFLLGAYLLGLPHCFGKIHHNEGLVLCVLVVLAFSRCGDGWSVDRLLGAARRGTDPPPSAEYTWPIRLVCVLLALVFFAAGIAKLRHSGPAWIASDNLALMLIQNHYHKVRTDPLTSWGLDLAQYGWLCRLLAAATVLIEVGYPLALVSRTARWVVVPGACLMLVGIRLLLGPAFEQFLMCSLFWVPWERAGLRAVAWMQAPPLPSGKPLAGWPVHGPLIPEGGVRADARA